MIRLDGVVGIARALELRERVLAARRSGGSVIVDCESADHLDTSALQLLLVLSREEAALGRQCRIVGVRPAVHRYIALAGLASALHTETARQPDDESEVAA